MTRVFKEGDILDADEIIFTYWYLGEVDDIEVYFFPSKLETEKEIIKCLNKFYTYIEVDCFVIVYSPNLTMISSSGSNDGAEATSSIIIALRSIKIGDTIPRHNVIRVDGKRKWIHTSIKADQLALDMFNILVDILSRNKALDNNGSFIMDEVDMTVR